MQQICEIPIKKLIPGSFQPRQKFNNHELQELSVSIKTTRSLLQPIIVRKLPGMDQFEIIAGERRWRAAIMAELEAVSCIIKNMTDQEALEAAIIENVNRKDLNVIEEAKAYARLLEEFNYTHDKIAKAIGKSRAKVTNLLRLLKLDSRVQEYILEGLLCEGHGKILVTLSKELQFKMARQIIKRGWSVRRIEQEVNRLVSFRTQERKKDANIVALERELADYVGCEVKINYQNNYGKLEINFHNLDILHGLLAKMGFKFNY
jgi:ParB family chromosome partitioning protein